MIKLRMQRIGRHGEPHYKVVAINATRGPKSANYIEELGSYNPKTGSVTLKNERVSYWLSVGAQASDTVFNFLVSKKLIESPKRQVKYTTDRKKKK